MTGVLFVCTANACRSQLAEALARRLFPPGVRVASAGTRPTALDGRAARVLGELGIDASGQRAKSLDEIAWEGIDRVITLCDDAAERCPVPADRLREHWPLPDPAHASGTAEEVLASFRAVRDDLFERLAKLAASMQAER